MTKTKRAVSCLPCRYCGLPIKLSRIAYEYLVADEALPCHDGCYFKQKRYPDPDRQVFMYDTYGEIVRILSL